MDRQHTCWGSQSYASLVLTPSALRSTTDRYTVRLQCVFFSNSKYMYCTCHGGVAAAWIWTIAGVKPRLRSSLSKTRRSRDQRRAIGGWWRLRRRSAMVRTATSFSPQRQWANQSPSAERLQIGWTSWHSLSNANHSHILVDRHGCSCSDHGFSSIYRACSCWSRHQHGITRPFAGWASCIRPVGRP